MFNRFRKKKTPPAEPDRSTLVPRIKTHRFTEFTKGMGIPDEPLAADLIIAYAFDQPGLFTHNLTGHLLVWRSGRWVEYADQE